MTHRLLSGGRPLLAKKEVLVAKSGFWEAPEGTSLLLEPIAAQQQSDLFRAPFSVQVL